MNQTICPEPQRATFQHDERGQTMVEYGLLIAFISAALVVVLGVTGFGGAVAAQFTAIVAGIAAAL
jgi:Flp pilus assembly pilin Flp